MKLAIVSTHPIQYYSPVFKLLAEKVHLKVFFTWGEDSVKKFDPGFGRTIEWDIPVLDGYPYEFLVNTSKHPGSSHFKGIVNPDIVERLTEFSPNAILIYGWAYQSHLKIMKHFKGKVPVWFRGDSNLMDERSGLKQVLRSLWLRRIYRNVDKAFYVGQANKAYYLKYGLKPEQLVFAPHAIDNERFGEDKFLEAGLLRKDLGVGENQILILFAGKFENKKSPIELLTAFLALKPANAKLLMVGDGVLKSQLIQIAGKEIDRSVHFLAFQNQQFMPALYQSADLLCLPSKGPGETWGLAVNEAMAGARPVLISNKVGCGPDLIEQGKTGWIFNDDLEATLKIILSNEDRTSLLKMGQEAKCRVSEYSLENQVKAFISQLHG